MTEWSGRRRVTIPQVIADAAAMFNQGRLQQAEHVLRQLIAARPDVADAHNILGAVLYRAGRTDEAIAASRDAIRHNGAVASYHANLGEMLRTAGRLDEAAGALRTAIRLDAGLAQAHNNLGIVMFEQRDFEGAAAAYRAALKLAPEYPEAHNNLGNALRALGQVDASVECYEHAIELRDNYAEAYNNLASALRNRLDNEAAELALRRAISLRPDYLDARTNLVALLIACERLEEAGHVVSETLKTLPDNPAALVLAARLHVARHAFQNARAILDGVLATSPDNVDALVLRAQVAHETDDFAVSLADYERAVELRPDHLEAMNGLGITLKSLGRLDEARTWLGKALDLAPGHSGVFANLVDLERFTPDHPLFLKMRATLQGMPDRTGGAAIALNYALGKVYDDMGDYEAAISHFIAGAEGKRKTVNYDEAESGAFFEGIREAYSKSYFEDPPYAGNPSTAPIFIVGMPRSGSTLTEQIVSSHPAVHGAGEVKYLSAALGALRGRYPSLPKYPKMVRSLKGLHFDSLAATYLSQLLAGANGAERVTDKLLSNFLFVGLIHTLFPDAKIIHTTRNPVDTCLSTFTKLFKDEMAHSYDLGELGRYYVRYQTLMAHWREVLPPGVMLDVSYEEMVEDTEAKSREVIAFLGLPWDKRCLAFHESTRPVKTASVSQVRQPIYSTSVARWRRYGAALDPLIEALGLSQEAAAGAGVPAPQRKRANTNS